MSACLVTGIRAAIESSVRAERVEYFRVQDELDYYRRADPLASADHEPQPARLESRDA